MIRHHAFLLALALAAPPQLLAQAGADSRPALGEATTRAIAGRYEVADHWVQKVVLLLSLNHWWHPSGGEMILAALQDKDARLKAFGLEALLRSDPKLLPTVASVALLDELIGKQIRHKNDLFKERVEVALALLVPDAKATNKREWQRWWQQNKEAFAAASWQAKQQPKNDGTGTSAVAQRAFDLHQHGLELMICIDSTGSMQPTIDALGAALGDMVDLLAGLSPKMRLGIVHFKDYGELGKAGAKVVQPFSKNLKTARKNLEKLRAHGGADLPEAGLGGMRLALSKKRKWKKDANKLVILIGDAPLHEDDRDAAVALAKAAFETPGQHTNKPTTGAKASAKKERPYLTSAIGVFVDVEGPKKPRNWSEFRASQDQMRKDFSRIAKAGGGVFVEVEFKLKMGPPPTSKDKRAAKKQGNNIASGATRQIVEHILVLSFGERFQVEMRELARIFYDYKAAGMIK